MQRIFLTGLAGSGKSTVGKHVATLLHWDFVDTDELLAEHAGRPVGQALTDYGEARFRELESAMLRQAASRERVVVATGGGTVIAAANRAFMRDQGLTIYLQTDPATAWQRIQAHLLDEGERVARPLIAGDDGLQRLHNLLEVRQTWYAEADIHLTTNETTPATLAQQVVVDALAAGQLLSAASARVSCNMRLTTAISQAVIEWGSLGQLPEALKAMNGQSRVFVVTDASVGALYARVVEQALVDGGLQPRLFTVPAGEASKSFDCFVSVIGWLVQEHAERSELVIALGGGVVGDLVGFVAATYQRGVPLVQVPTTLLAQVDSAIGGKTGINHPLGKNLIGAYHQPGLIFVDPAVLLTLPERAYCEGWGEIVKYGVILDAELFTLLEEHLTAIKQRDPDLLTQIVARCIRIKMDIVQADEQDGGLRNLLNYGHTFGHALEATTTYGTWLHGEAVSIGMEVAGRIAVARELITPDDLLRQRTLLQAIGLPIACPGVDGAAILRAMQHDKKVQAGRTRWILPTSIGKAHIYKDVPIEDVQTAIAAVCAAQEALQ